MNFEQIVSQQLNDLRTKVPLVHSITNYVVMNNTANALLSVGASPLMAHAEEEMDDIVNIVSSVVLNIGTLSTPWIKAMLKAGKKAKTLKKPLTLDPVGAGASKLRNDTCATLLEECAPDIIRGNASEIMALANVQIKSKGVDSTEDSANALAAAKLLAQTTKAVIVVSGVTDYITNGENVIMIKNGHPLMAKVTGMGCSASALVGAFAALSNDHLANATSAMTIMGICGEMAAEKATAPGSFQVYFLDALYNITAKDITERIKVSM